MGVSCVLKGFFCCFPSLNPHRKWNEVTCSARAPLIKHADNIKMYNKGLQKIEDKVQKDALNVLKEQEDHIKKMNRELWKMEDQTHKEVVQALKKVGEF